MIRKKIAAIIKEAGDRCVQKGIFPPETEIKPIIEIPKELEHGDYSTNLAFLLARSLRKSPEVIAKALIECMDFESVCTKVDVAAKGFVNFHVRDEVYRSALKDVAKQGLEPFLPDVGEGQESAHRVRERKSDGAAARGPRSRCCCGRRSCKSSPQSRF